MNFKYCVAFLFCAFLSLELSAQDYWQRNNGTKKSSTEKGENPKGVKSIFLDIDAFRSASQQSAKGFENKTQLYFPNEIDAFESFILTQTHVIAPHVANSAPDIKTYKGYSTQREGVSIRLTISSRGVNYVMRINNELMFMEYKNNSNEHIYYMRKDIDRSDRLFKCGVTDQLNILTPELYQRKKKSTSQKVTSDQILRTFRIAVVGTATYTANWGTGTQADAYNAVVNTINRVNEVFETDLGVTLTIVSTPSLMLNDPSINPMRIGDTSGAGEAQNVLHGVMNTISSTLDASDYDIGHGFHKFSIDEFNNGFTTSFGLGPAVCNDNDWNGEGPAKAGGISRVQFAPLQTTDAFDIDYVAHEIGHQFGAEHTFSYQASPNLMSAEPGSGSTIMAYAGVTSHDIQSNSDPYYHYLSIDQINGYLTSGFTCSATSTIGNSVPTINAGSDVSIPHGTAYKLEATATDSDASLYYCWEQLDTGTQIITTNFGPTQTSGPMARSLAPTTTSIRYIPNMNRVIAGELTKTNPADVSGYPTTNDDWETVATVSRTLNWGVTVRDRSNASVSQNGQINQDEKTISVVNSAGPFRVTSQSNAGIVYNEGSNINVTWDVAQTNLPPVNTSLVNILLSSDGGYNYSYTLATNIPNNGNATVTLPNGVSSTSARIKVEPVGNIYFAINSIDFELKLTSNRSPIAVADTIAVMRAGTATTLNDGVTTSVLANDTDPDGDALTAVLINNTTQGTLTLNANGTFSYVHGGINFPSDSFSYSANDTNINSVPVTVTITVSGTNNIPVASPDNIIVTLGGTATTLDNGQTSVLANDSDPDGDALSATLVTSPTFGTLTLDPGGTFSYVQNGTNNSGDSFTYTATDGILSSSTTTVNILLSCSPCVESIIEAGQNGVSFSYTDCLCKTVRVYVPKGKAYTFCHLDGSITTNAGNYTLITSKACD